MYLHIFFLAINAILDPIHNFSLEKQSFWSRDVHLAIRLVLT